MNALHWDLGDGLVVRTYTLDDAQTLFDLIDTNRAHLRPWMVWEQTTKGTDDTRAFIQSCLDEAGQHRGERRTGSMASSPAASAWTSTPCRTAVRSGYWLAKPHEGRGIIARACERFFDMAFDELGLHRMELQAAAANARSRAVAGRLGMQEEGVARDGIRVAEGISTRSSTPSWRTSGEHVGCGREARPADRARRWCGAPPVCRRGRRGLVRPDRCEPGAFSAVVPLGRRRDRRTSQAAYIESRRASDRSLDGNGIWVGDDLAGGCDLMIGGSDDVGELGFWLDEAFVGRGLVTRAAQALMDRGFGEGCTGRSCAPGVDNLRSRAVAKRLGMREEGVLRGAGKVGRRSRRPGRSTARSSTTGASPSDVAIRAVHLDLYGTLVPEFPHEDFYASIDHMATVLGADIEAFRDAWNETVVARQTGGYATIETTWSRSARCSACPSRTPSRCRRRWNRARGCYRPAFRPRDGADRDARPSSGRVACRSP